MAEKLYIGIDLGGTRIRAGKFNANLERLARTETLTLDEEGVEAVIDKDLSSALLAIGIKADLFLISTAVEKVALNFGKPNERTLGEMTLAEAEKYYAEGHFPSGSMGPKIQAVINYLKNGGKKALITNPSNIERALLGETGTWITH